MAGGTDAGSSPTTIIAASLSSAAQAHAGEIENGVGRHVGQPQRHPIAWPDAEIRQALGGARRAIEQFDKAQSLLAVDEGRCIRRLLGDVGEQGPDVGGGMDERHARGD